MTSLGQERAVIDRLLDWYEEHGRHDLPWRQPDTTPFQVLLAVFLLQQTRVEQAARVYPELVRRYPAPRDLVRDDDAEEELRRLIAPLGLPRRAEYMARSAEQIAERHGGDIPDRYDELIRLHGVGDYTANAVLAHAHGTDVGAVDINVARILSRALGVGPDDRCTDEHRDLAHRLAPPGDASAYNEALIDLGALICTARDPDCPACPLSDDCSSRTGPR